MLYIQFESINSYVYILYGNPLFLTVLAACSNYSGVTLIYLLITPLPRINIMKTITYLISVLVYLLNIASQIIIYSFSG